MRHAHNLRSATRQRYANYPYDHEGEIRHAPAWPQRSRFVRDVDTVPERDREEAARVRDEEER